MQCWTGHTLPEEESAVYKQLKETQKYASENGMIINFKKTKFCQTQGLVLRLRVDFVLLLSQEEQQEQQEEQEQEPLTKIYQKGV